MGIILVRSDNIVDKSEVLFFSKVLHKPLEIYPPDPVSFQFYCHSVKLKGLDFQTRSCYVRTPEKIAAIE